MGLSSSKWFIATDLRFGKVVHVTVRNGQQRSEGTPHVSLRDARAWMKDNGFEKAQNQVTRYSTISNLGENR